MLLVLLQNAWAKTRRQVDAIRSNHRMWLRLLEYSRSGRRLKLILGDDCFRNPLIRFANTTPRIGWHSTSRLKPDLQHVGEQIDLCTPDVLLACGQQAEQAALCVWSGPLLCVPHPTSRTLTNELYLSARRSLAKLTSGRVALRQARGEVVRESLTLSA